MSITIQTGKIKTNVHLSKIAVQYNNAAFVMEKLAPAFPVNKESDKFRKYKRDGYFSGAPKRADGAPAEEASLSYDDDTYTTFERAIKDIVTDRAMNNADDVFNLKADTTKFLTEKIKLGVELDAAILLTGATGGISSASPDHVVTPSNLWDDYTNSDPESDIATGKEAVSARTARVPNVILIPPHVERYLAHHPQVKELRKYWDPTALTKGGLPNRLWDMEVVIAPAIYDSAKQGIATATMAYVWGKNVILAYVNPADTITLARTFVLKSRNMQVTTWRDDEREGDWIRVVNNYVPKMICSDCGYLLASVIT